MTNPIEKLIPIPYVIQQTLIHDIQKTMQYCNEVHFNERLDNYCIQLCFLKAMCSLLSGFEQHIGMIRITPHSTNCVFMDDFLETRKREERDFFSKVYKYGINGSYCNINKFTNVYSCKQ